MHSDGSTANSFGDQHDVVALEEADEAEDSIGAETFRVPDFVDELPDLLGVELFGVLVDAQFGYAGAVYFEDAEAGLLVVAADEIEFLGEVFRF